MDWRGRKRSSNIEDRRGASRGRGIRLPGLGGRRAGRKSGIGLVGVVVAVGAAMLFGIDPMLVLQMMGGGGGMSSGVGMEMPRSGPVNSSPKEKEQAEFVSVVLADTEVTWNGLFRSAGQNYQEPKLVMFRGAVQSACGSASSAVGPFYCPGDRKVYLDLSFFDELSRRFGAPGDFAQAYVIAHEVGHHVQTLLGISASVQKAKQGASQKQANAVQVRMELQADCFAGIWANHADRFRNLLESGDVEEALRAANAIGDDTIQRRSQGHVVPDAFTHGSAEQRMRWFKVGLDRGSVQACDTFQAARL